MSKREDRQKTISKCPDCGGIGRTAHSFLECVRCKGWGYVDTVTVEENNDSH